MLWFIVLQVALATFSAGQDNNTTNNNYDLADVLASEPQLSTFTTSLNQVQWLLELTTNANCTILAPSNDAFANYSSGDDIGAVLSYHVLEGVHALVDLRNAGEKFLPTELTDPEYSNVTGGQRVGVIPQGDDLFFEGGWKTRSKLITPDLPFGSPNSTNGVYNLGVIHIIDSVLNMPVGEVPTQTKLNLNGPLSVELTIPYDPDPEVAGVTGYVSDWTFFAPNTLAPYSTSNISNSQFYRLEEYHLIKGSVHYSPDLTNGLQLRTVEGADITITRAPNGTIYVNDVEILWVDYLVSNGVLHVIDHPLNPNDTNARPAFVSNNTTTTNTTIVASSASSGLSTGAKAGIGAGVGFGALIVLALLALYFLRSRKQKNQSAATPRRGRYKKGLALEMEQPQTHELQASKTGQSWEVDGQETQRWRVYEMQ